MAAIRLAFCVRLRQPLKACVASRQLDRESMNSRLLNNNPRHCCIIPPHSPRRRLEISAAARSRLSFFFRRLGLTSHGQSKHFHCAVSASSACVWRPNNDSFRPEGILREKKNNSVFTYVRFKDRSAYLKRRLS